MEALVESVAFFASGTLVTFGTQHVGVAFIPGRVVHFGHDGLDVAVGFVEDVVETHGVHHIPVVA